MADLERGQRIKKLRREKAAKEGRRVTQQHMADAAGVTLRAAQEWEYGGGIDEEHLPVLIKFLQTDANYLLRGDTPDLLADIAAPALTKEEADRIEKRISDLDEKLDEIIERLPPAEPVEDDEDLKRARDAAERLTRTDQPPHEDAAPPRTPRRARKR